MADVPNFVNAAFANAVPGPASPGQAFARSWFLIQELEHADAALIATPMHNFTVPALLKTWTEQVVRIHRAFSNSQAGKISVLADRPVFIVIASSGWFTLPSPTCARPRPDCVTLYLRAPS